MYHTFYEYNAAILGDVNSFALNARLLIKCNYVSLPVAAAVTYMLM